MSPSIHRVVVLSASLALAAGAVHARTFQQQVPAKPDGEVHIDNIAGSIVVSGWDQPVVSVIAKLTSDTQRVLVISASGQTRVCVTNGSSSCGDESWSGRTRRARLEVHVPRGSEVDASGVSAGITSDGVAGVQRLHTVSGDIRADLGSGNDDVKSVSGAIRLRGSGQEGTLHAATVSGDLTITDVAGELEARTVNGTLSASLSPARVVRLSTTSGAIELHAHLMRGGTVQSETVSGRQTIDVIAPAGYSYEARTFSGDIGDCFGQRPDRSRYGPGNRLEGKRGEGDGGIRVKSLSGSISICDH